MILSADANLFLYTAKGASPFQEKARWFFEEQVDGDRRFLLCGLVLVEIYMQLRNPAVLRKSKTAGEATACCDALRAHPVWVFGGDGPEVGNPLWNCAARTTTGSHEIIDARLAFTLRHHGVTHFATANDKHFEDFGFERVWNPVAA